MGMYDYLNGEQVKCFPTAIVYDVSKYGGVGVKVSTISGSLKSYCVGDTVPHRTPIYDYGEDFIVYDYRCMSIEEEPLKIHFIASGLVSKYIELNNITQDLELGLDELEKTTIIDNFGNKLNIKDKTDMVIIAEEFKEMIDIYFRDYKELKVLFNLYLDKLRDGIEDTELMNEYDLKNEELLNRTIKSFNSKWLSNESMFSNNIGNFIECFQSGFDDKEELKTLLNQYIKDNVDYYDSLYEYKNWVKGYLSEEEVDRILNS